MNELYLSQLNDNFFGFPFVEGGFCNTAAFARASYICIQVNAMLGRVSVPKHSDGHYFGRAWDSSAVFHFRIR